MSREDLLAVVALQQRQIEDLKATVAGLAEEVRELRSRGNRNSGNSSKPPSSDVFVKPERRKKPSSGWRQGKQPGASGTSLSLVEHPEVTVEVFPPSCGSCRTVLPEVSAGFVRRLCHDIPPRSVTVSETRWHRVRCGCGFVTAAHVPDGIPDAPYYEEGRPAHMAPRRC